MKFLKLKLLVFALFLCASGPAFASSIYDVKIDTTGLGSPDGYLYLQYVPVSADLSSVTVSNFATDGTLGAQSSNVVDGSAVSGTLPGAVTFLNTNGINDYNQAITFGTSINFRLSFSDPVTGGQDGGSSTFSLGLFADASGMTPLYDANDPEYPAGTLFTVDLVNDGTTAHETLGLATVNPVPEPATMALFGFGLIGLAGIRRRTKK